MSIYEVVLNQEGVGGDVKNVLHYDISVDDAGVNQEITDRMMTAWVLHMQTITVPSHSFLSVTFRQDSVGAVGIEYTPGAGAQAGTATNSDVMAQAALLVRKVNTDGNRPVNGRAYMGGLSTGAFDPDGTWGTDALAGCKNFFDDLITITGLPLSATAQLLIKASNPTAPNTVPYADVSVIQRSDNPVTQRRRRIGTGS